MKLLIEVNIVPDKGFVSIFLKDEEMAVRWEWYSETLQGGLDAIPIVTDLVSGLVREFEIEDKHGAVA